MQRINVHSVQGASQDVRIERAPQSSRSLLPGFTAGDLFDIWPLVRIDAQAVISDGMFQMLAAVAGNSLDMAPLIYSRTPNSTVTTVFKNSSMQVLKELLVIDANDTVAAAVQYSQNRNCLKVNQLSIIAIGIVLDVLILARVSLILLAPRVILPKNPDDFLSSSLLLSSSRVFSIPFCQQEALLTRS